MSSKSSARATRSQTSTASTSSRRNNSQGNEALPSLASPADRSVSNEEEDEAASASQSINMHAASQSRPRPRSRSRSRTRSLERPSRLRQTTDDKPALLIGDSGASPMGDDSDSANAGGGGVIAEMDSLESSDDASDSYGSEDDYAWIPWFCALKGNEFFCEVDEEFAQDAFNLTGLEQLVPYFDQALDMILDVETDLMTEDTQEIIENDAENLFGLIHARYIITARGLQAMLEKYRLFHFGRCPRVLCRGQAVLPIGLSDTPNEDSVKLYCPRCEEVYATKSPRHEHIDGAYFGTTFPHLFYLTFPELKVSKSKEYYMPRVFGFKIHKSAYKKSLEMRKKEKQREKEKKRMLENESASMQQQQHHQGHGHQPSQSMNSMTAAAQQQSMLTGNANNMLGTYGSSPQPIASWSGNGKQ